MSSGVDWASKAKTASFDEAEIIRHIMALHNDGRPFDVDPTYSTGRFWRGLSEPLHKFDLHPQAPGVTEADARCLPLLSGSVRSIMFDPPFVVAPSRKPGIIRDRFACYKDVPDLWAFYQEALTEFWRLLRPEGIVAFKCQDIVSGGVQHMSHAAVMVMAQELGFYLLDLFVLVRKTVLWSPNMNNQRHARKNHCYFLVLQKPGPQGARARARAQLVNRVPRKTTEEDTHEQA